MKKVIRLNMKFWNILSQPKINLDEINDELLKIKNIHDDLEQRFRPLKSYMNRKKEIKYYYYWYRKNIQNITLKMQDTDDVLKNLGKI